MRNPTRLFLAAALVSFGAAAASSTPALADTEIIPCEGRQEPLCYTTTSTECTRLTICAITSKGVVSCCVEKQITTTYHYFN